MLKFLKAKKYMDVEEFVKAKEPWDHKNPSELKAKGKIVELQPSVARMTKDQTENSIEVEDLKSTLRSMCRKKFGSDRKQWSQWLD